MNLTFRAVVIVVLLFMASLQVVTSYCIVADYSRGATAREKYAAEERYAEKLRQRLGNP